MNAAIASVSTYAAAPSPNSPDSIYTVYDLVNTWAPVSVNPNAMANFLSTLGMSQAMAQSTKLTDLSTGEMLDVIAAFAWQEGFKPAGCNN
ncbi:hypothetical protein GCM10010981_19190 [Dyella nitratireducens]|uniref:Uncharacterized protein n=1 Tax=Dyella nitratireducens TaxID=1849580 RepID=A0ABQ1FVH4_9GAMM|nr:hypothetical protein GCM10010981_19190 [Dyella nitratireducens]GLQ43018.1 hypothetical protein GCM10007902_28680 [Dyella nitratireducens]